MRHLILKLRGCKNTKALKSAERLRALSDGIMTALNMTVVGTLDHQFRPHGATMIYLLAESHCAIHTFWEEAECCIDIFCCKDFDAALASRLFIDAFGSDGCDESLLDRS
jgi:S-adenosylmethionine decarboxylase